MWGTHPRRPRPRKIAFPAALSEVQTQLRAERVRGVVLYALCPKLACGRVAASLQPARAQPLAMSSSSSRSDTDRLTGVCLFGAFAFAFGAGPDDGAVCVCVDLNIQIDACAAI